MFGRCAGVLCQLLSGRKIMVVWPPKGTSNAIQEAQAERDHPSDPVPECSRQEREIWPATRLLNRKSASHYVGPGRARIASRIRTSTPARQPTGPGFRGWRSWGRTAIHPVPLAAVDPLWTFSLQIACLRCGPSAIRAAVDQHTKFGNPNVSGGCSSSSPRFASTSTTRRSVPARKYQASR